METTEIRPRVYLVPALEGFRWNPARLFEDGDYVIAHSVAAEETVSGNPMV